jgi:hypothetical protein
MLCVNSGFAIEDLLEEFAREANVLRDISIATCNYEGIVSCA